ncbi:Putative aliphatic sulfonates transport permease protein SsuC [Oligella sp. MSHR50489EDL]|uniref:ABC transporter permease n=1 Tax=Oligella sp. MSHR50489EDL TaxID=3139409 RepID=UPI003D81C079
MLLSAGRPLRQSSQARLFSYCWAVWTALAVVAVVCAFWHLGSVLLGEIVLPGPVKVFKLSIALLHNYQSAEIPHTLFRATVAISSAVLTGVALGLLTGLSKTMALFCRPLISILLGTPPIIWVVLAIFWFSTGDSSTIFTTYIAVTPLMFASALQGMLSIDHNLEEVMQVYKVSYFRRVRHLYWPHLLNHLLPAFNIAFASGLKIAIMAELLGSSDGIGAQIGLARTMLDTDIVMAYIVILLLIIYLVEYLIIEPLKILFLPWGQNRV